MSQATFYRFGPHDLQEVWVWLPPEKSEDSLFWIMYVALFL